MFAAQRGSLQGSEEENRTVAKECVKNANPRTVERKEIQFVFLLPPTGGVNKPCTPLLPCSTLATDQLTSSTTTLCSRTHANQFNTTATAAFCCVWGWRSMFYGPRWNGFPFFLSTLPSAWYAPNVWGPRGARKASLTRPRANREWKKRILN